MKSAYKTAVMGMVFLLAAGITSAVVMSSYGTITGTANVEPSVEITNVNTSSDEVELTKNLESNITADDDVDLFNVTNGNENELAGDIEMSSQTENTGVNSLENVDDLELRIQGTTINSTTVEGGQ
jgi:hypothetical protein